jgi:hypothetical protein
MSFLQVIFVYKRISLKTAKVSGNSETADTWWTGDEATPSA